MVMASLTQVATVLLFLHTAFQYSDDRKGLVDGLKLESVVIPETVILGSSETLTCDFQQESDQLLSLKWFKDGHEFFRFTPNEDKQISTFPVPGFVVQGRDASLNRVTITSQTLDGSGIYRCEILADKPSFQTLFQEGNLSIIVPPEPKQPTIRNISSMVLMGETINGNCTSTKSFPAAQLTFHINDEKMDVPHVIEYPPIMEQSTKTNLPLQTSVLGLRIQVSHRYFRRGQIAIKCTARIGQRTWESEKIVQHLNNYPSHLSVYGKTKSDAGAVKCNWQWQLFLMMSVSVLVSMVNVSIGKI